MLLDVRITKRKDKRFCVNGEMVQVQKKVYMRQLFAYHHNFYTKEGYVFVSRFQSLYLGNNWTDSEDRFNWL